MRGPVLWALAVAVLAISDVAAGRFVVEKASLRVTSPEDLEGKYECAMGNFGVPQYGGTLHGTVFYPESNMEACNGFNVSSFKSNTSGGRPLFVLIDRGGDDGDY